MFKTASFLAKKNPEMLMEYLRSESKDYIGRYNNWELPIGDENHHTVYCVFDTDNEKHKFISYLKSENHLDDRGRPALCFENLLPGYNGMCAHYSFHGSLIFYIESGLRHNFGIYGTTRHTRPG